MRIFPSRNLLGTGRPGVNLKPLSDKRTVPASSGGAGPVPVPVPTVIIFFGEELGPLENVTGAPLTQRNAFAANINPSLQPYDFSEYGVGAALVSMTLGSITAAFSYSVGGTGTVVSGPALGRFATSEDNYWQQRSLVTVTINFSSPVSFFGFYGTDIGDFSGSLQVETTDAVSAAVATYTVANTTSPDGAISGSLLFWGIQDTGRTYSRIRLICGGSSIDFFGFDDIWFGGRALLLI